MLKQSFRRILPLIFPSSGETNEENLKNIDKKIQMVI